MRVTQKQIKDGISRYLKDEVVTKITDKPVKMAMAFAIKMIENNDCVIDSVMNNSIVSFALEADKDGTFDLNSAVNAINEVMDEYGTFDFELPIVKTKMSFGKTDIAKMKQYIEGSV